MILVLPQSELWRKCSQYLTLSSSSSITLRWNRSGILRNSAKSTLITQIRRVFVECALLQRRRLQPLLTLARGKRNVRSIIPPNESFTWCSCSAYRVNCFNALPTNLPVASSSLQLSIPIFPFSVTPLFRCRRHPMTNNDKKLPAAFAFNFTDLGECPRPRWWCRTDLHHRTYCAGLCRSVGFVLLILSIAIKALNTKPTIMSCPVNVSFNEESMPRCSLNDIILLWFCFIKVVLSCGLHELWRLSCVVLKKGKK